jgi:hypothetical protein
MSEKYTKTYFHIILPSTYRRFLQCALSHILICACRQQFFIRQRKGNILFFERSLVDHLPSYFPTRALWALLCVKSM